MRPLALPLVACLLLAGCNIWPRGGTGGFAELSGTPPTPALAAASGRLQQLATADAGKRAPAALAEARLLLVRATRSAAAGFEVADADLQALEASLARLEQAPADGAAAPTSLF